ncbi:testicular haploid expressed gene protein-like isoform X2 [Ischnura elegans]|uniref:testicular haploid expressed gene protein-like isoform X2 n=1 Tax=Ischnura elegans TaxID=197161 RepID=UPI001ED88A98|nr:testicular haploid expressed gene protein-like isoform X2 [Ischnura elegans]
MKNTAKKSQKKRVFKTYTDYLAAPNPRRLYSEPKVKLGHVPRAALRAKATKRIKQLAHPRSLPTSMHSWDGAPSVEPAALRYQITERLKELSIPAPRGTSSSALVSCSSKDGIQMDHQERIEMLSRPVYHPPPAVPRRGRKVPLGKLIKRIKSLSQPAERDLERHRAKEWKFTEAMNNYKPSDRLNAISKPITRPNIHVNFDPQVSEAAKNFQATERLKVLAQPKRKAQEPDSELRENPFQVSPMALKARCSNRLKELAIPPKRGKK